MSGKKRLSVQGVICLLSSKTLAEKDLGAEAGLNYSKISGNTLFFCSLKWNLPAGICGFLLIYTRRKCVDEIF